MASSRDPSPAHEQPLLAPSRPPAPSYPLLTPSGHALASGGRVRNISLDPMSPCVMYWPDNEPLPERGQIRPSGSVVIQYPPIINTGNKGAAEKQPGDWLCSKCNYLNWRRRKVCQTCFPYAEGNGDSISQAVQAERISLLTNVLNTVNGDLPIQRPPAPAQSPAQFTYNHHQPNGFADGPVAGPAMGPRAATIAASASASVSARSRSHKDLRSSFRGPPPSHNGIQFQNYPQTAIYQTYGQQSYRPHPASPGGTVSSTRSSRVPSPSSSVGHGLRVLAETPYGNPDITPNANATTLLPAFLQDLVHSSALHQSNLPSIHSSPSTSTSSWSLDEHDYDYEYTSTRDRFGLCAQHPSYNQFSHTINSHQMRNDTGLRSVDAAPSIYSAGSTAIAGDDAQKRDVGVIGIGRPPRLGSTTSAYDSSSSSGSVASTPSVESIWKIDSDESRNGIWKSSGAFGVDAGAGTTAHRSRSYHSARDPRFVGFTRNSSNGPVLEGYGFSHGLGGLDERLAARLTIGSNRSASASNSSGRNESGLVSAV